MQPQINDVVRNAHKAVMYNQGDIYIAQNEAGLKNRKPLNQYCSWQEVNTACLAGTICRLPWLRVVNIW